MVFLGLLISFLKLDLVFSNKFLIFVRSNKTDTFIMKANRKGKVSDYVKANRSASREVELESENGFVSTHKVFKSKKNYDRKLKHKNLGEN